MAGDGHNQLNGPCDPKIIADFTSQTTILIIELTATIVTRPKP